MFPVYIICATRVHRRRVCRDCALFVFLCVRPCAAFVVAHGGSCVVRVHHVPFDHARAASHVGGANDGGAAGHVPQRTIRLRCIRLVPSVRRMRYAPFVCMTRRNRTSCGADAMGVLQGSSERHPSWTQCGGRGTSARTAAEQSWRCFWETCGGRRSRLGQQRLALGA